MKNNLIEEKQIFKNLLEEIAQELSQHYKGKLTVVETHSDEAAPAYLYLQEERAGKKFLGIFPRKERRIIFATLSMFYVGAFGAKEISIYVGDYEANSVVGKYIAQFVRKYDVTKVNAHKKGFKN